MTRHIHIVKVHHLTLSFPTRKNPNPKPVLNDVDFGIRDGEILGLIGNSGCGKTMTSLVQEEPVQCLGAACQGVAEEGSEDIGVLLVEIMQEL